MSYGIKAGYRENAEPRYFIDHTPGVVYQPDVYTMARFLAVMLHVDRPRIVDIGCGTAGKLAEMHDQHPDWRYVGVDQGDNLDQCREHHPWGTWLECDLEHRAEFPPADVVICSDVIEHLVDPTPLLESLATMTGSLIVLSTPERDVQHGLDHMGPSPNVCHVREWNAAELHHLLTEAGFTIEHHGLTRGHDGSWIMPTQLVVMRP